MSSQMKKLIKRVIIYTIMIIFTVIYYFFFVRYGKGIPCLFLKFFNVPCISCGATRAFYALIKFDFVAAFHYNALFTVLIYPSLSFLILNDFYHVIRNVLKHQQKKSIIVKLFEYKKFIKHKSN